jgi:hypothetical protein
MNFEHETLDYIIYVSGELFTKSGGHELTGCDIIIDDDSQVIVDDIVEPTPQYGCVAIGPLNQIGKDGKFSSWYFICLLGADPSTVPIPNSVTSRVHISPGIWEPQTIKVLPSMVRARDAKAMHIDLGEIEWTCAVK